MKRRDLGIQASPVDHVKRPLAKSREESATTKWGDHIMRATLFVAFFHHASYKITGHLPLKLLFIFSLFVLFSGADPSARAGIWAWYGIFSRGRRKARERQRAVRRVWRLAQSG